MQTFKALEPGTVVGEKWYILRLIGAGGMAAVYEAQHRNGKRVALKILHEGLLPDTRAVERFLREGSLANVVDHPGVVSVLDDGVAENGAPYLVMEFLEGEDLGGRLERLDGPLVMPDALAIGSLALEALGAAHEAGVIHRDLKPDNLFLCVDGRVKILDFGIARLIQSTGGDLKTLTEIGMALGTIKYMSREQALGDLDRINGQSDLWSLGATLYRALSGQFLYESRNSTEYLMKLLHGAPRPLGELVPSMPGAVAEVIDRALLHEQSERWSSAGAIRKALLEAAERSGVEIPRWPSAAGFSPPPRPRSRPRNLPPAPSGPTPSLPEPAAPPQAAAPAAGDGEQEDRNAPTVQIRAPKTGAGPVVAILAGAVGLGFALVSLLRAPAQEPAPSAGPPTSLALASTTSLASTAPALASLAALAALASNSAPTLPSPPRHQARSSPRTSQPPPDIGTSRH
jgi:serine/threonine-protein kinase